MTTRNLPARLAAVLAAALLPMALLAGTALAAGPASAATTPRIASGSIFGPCNSFQDGEYRHFGRNLYQCVYVWGLGYYWVSVPAACGAPASAARETAPRC